MSCPSCGAATGSHTTLDEYGTLIVLCRSCFEFRWARHAPRPWIRQGEFRDAHVKKYAAEHPPVPGLTRREAA